MSEKTVYHIVSYGDLRSQGFHARFDDPDRIGCPNPAKRKTMLDNPAAGDECPAQILAVQGRQIVGRMDFLPGELIVRGQRRPMLWASNLYVPEAHRGSLAGLMLIMKSHGLADTVGVVGVSKIAHQIYQKLNWLDRPMPRFMLIRRSRSVVEKFLGPGVPSKLAAPLVDAGLAVFRGICAPARWRATRNLRVERASRLPQDFDTKLALTDAPVAAVRSAGVVNWLIDNRFTNDPRDANQLFILRERTGTPAGYFITKIRFHPTASHRGFKNVLLGSLQDWISLSPAVDEWAVIQLATRELCRLGVDAVEICTDTELLHSRLKRNGFVRVGELHMMFKLAKISPLNDEASSLATWRIRPADGDHYFA